MKRTLLSGFGLITAITISSQIVNIPDTNFKSYLIGNTGINTNADNEIQVAEAQAYNGLINCSTLGITDLTGIEAFTSLTKLTCSSNQLTSLDLTNNTALTELRCQSNQIQSLFINACPSLTILNCRSNELTSLNINNNTSLTYLECWNNQLTALDLSSHSNLSWINCSSNFLTTLSLPTSGTTTFLSCGNNELTTIDVSGLLQLGTLNFSGNELTAIDLSVNNSITNLVCTDNQLTSLDISNLTSLIEVSCKNNFIVSLDLSANPDLVAVHAQDNALTTLNVANGNNGNFTTFYAHGNDDLTCIQVDDEAYSTANWTGGYFYAGSNPTFSEDCMGSGLWIDNIDSKSIDLYPNPTKDILNVKVSPSEEFISASVINISGQKLFTSNESSVDLSHLASGTYFIEAITTKGSFIKKCIKH